uniref:Phosphorylated adapter RNA export protein n=1 Tax=Ananas comosus var. bracteatus TaxID=296719 RepID=A0A6V7QTB6_ANACO
MEEGAESVLDAIYEESALGDEDETLGPHGAMQDDVEMVDAETLDGDGDAVSPERSAAPPGAGGGDGVAEGGDQIGGQKREGKKKKKKKRSRNKKRKGGSSSSSILDINRFVIDTCRRLKERKSYLVWNAVGCLGVSVVSDLVREVESIQSCGGQMTADGKRLRNGGGILWNILKTREPKAYKEIMVKGREFEKQLRQPKYKQISNKNEDTSSQSTIVPDEDAEIPYDSKQISNAQEGLPSDGKMERKSVLERIRLPVSYDDLFEEGEIQE